MEEDIGTLRGCSILGDIHIQIPSITIALVVVIFRRRCATPLAAALKVKYKARFFDYENSEQKRV